MKFIVSRNKLLSALQHCRCMIGKNAVEMFKDFLFTFGEDGVTMTVVASNGEEWLTEQVTLDETGKELRTIGFYYSELLRAVKSLEDQPLEFVVGEYQATVKHSSGSFRLPLSNAAVEFEEFLKSRYSPDDGGKSPYYSIEYEAPGLRSILGKCRPYMAQDELRPALSGVYIDLTSDRASYIASNGHTLIRLCKKPIEQDGKAVVMSLILPASAVRNLLKILPSTGDVVLEYQEALKEERQEIRKNWAGNGETKVYTENVVLRKAVACATINATVRYSFIPIDGRYPNYNSVIPQHNTYEVMIGRKQLVKSISRLLIFAPESSMMIINATKEQTRLSVEYRDCEMEGEETLTCECCCSDDKEFEDIRYGVNARLLASILNTIPTEKVVMKYENASRACLVLPVPQSDVEEVTAIIMPIHIND